MDLFEPSTAVNQSYRIYEKQDVSIDIKREDLIHKEVSGNKLRKLKYNLLQAQKEGFDKVITFGGAFSNHIAATAAACKLMGLQSIGVIRGEELEAKFESVLQENQTLRTAFNNGMKFHFVSRNEYKQKDTTNFKNQLLQQFGISFMIPEGGTNELAIQGASEILTQQDLANYDFICVAAGTGGTAAGIIQSTTGANSVLVFSALAGDFLEAEIQKYTAHHNFTLFQEDTFGGYARSNNELIDFMNVRFRESGIPLEPIYTGKMMYRVEQLVEQGYFTGKTRILAIHTGGLQGIHGYNRKLLKKKRLTISYEHQI